MAYDSFVVRKLQARENDAVARLLARAFADNPAYAFMHPRAASRARDLVRFFQRNLTWRQALALTWVVTDHGDRVLGTATLEPPGGVPHRRRDVVRHWLVPTLREQGPRTALRIAQADADFGRHGRIAAGGSAYWHVHAVAVDPEAQGHGAGRFLLASVFRELDELLVRRPAPVVLSTQRERNVRLYRSFGFDVVNEVVMGAGRDAFTSWFMRRRAP